MSGAMSSVVVVVVVVVVYECRVASGRVRALHRYGMAGGQVQLNGYALQAIKLYRYIHLFFPAGTEWLTDGGP